MYDFFKECGARGIEVKSLQDKMLTAARTRRCTRYEKKWLGLRTKKASQEWIVFDLKPIEINSGTNREKMFMLVYTDENGTAQQWNQSAICHHDNTRVYTAVTLSPDDCFDYLKKAGIFVDSKEVEGR